MRFLANQDDNKKFEQDLQTFIIQPAWEAYATLSNLDKLVQLSSLISRKNANKSFAVAIQEAFAELVSDGLIAPLYHDSPKSWPTDAEPIANHHPEITRAELDAIAPSELRHRYATDAAFADAVDRLYEREGLIGDFFFKREGRDICFTPRTFWCNACRKGHQFGPEFETTFVNLAATSNFDEAMIVYQDWHKKVLDSEVIH